MGSTEARQLRQVLGAAQAGHSQEDSVHGRDDTHKGQTEGQVYQSGQFAAAREGLESDTKFER